MDGCMIVGGWIDEVLGTDWAIWGNPLLSSAHQGDSIDSPLQSHKEAKKNLLIVLLLPKTKAIARSAAKNMGSARTTWA